jgi:hypothetical protein
MIMDKEKDNSSTFKPNDHLANERTLPGSEQGLVLWPSALLLSNSLCL